MKMITTILISAMTLTACGINIAVEETGKAKEKETVTLRVWGAKEDQELLGELIEGFKEEHNDEAIFDIILEEQEEVDCKYNILNNVNEAADIFTFVDDQLMTFAAAGVIEPITYQNEIAQTNIEGAVNAAKLGEQIYAYPLTADNGYFMYYNKNYFSEQDVKSLDTMLEVAKKHNKKIAMEWDAGWYLYAFFGNTGLTLGLNDDYVTNYCTWNAKDSAIKGTDVVEAMRKIATSGAFVNVNSDEFIAGIQEGSIIAGVNGAWNAVTIQNAWQDGYAASKLPTYTVAGQQVQMASYAGYKMIGVNSHCENKEWAEQLALYLSNEESQELRFQRRGQGPSNINAANSEEVNGSIAIKALIEQSEFASIQRVGELYWDAARKLGEAIASGNFNDLSHQQFLDEIVKEMTASIVED